MAFLTNSWVTDFFTFSTLFITITYFYFTRKFNYWKKKNIRYEEPVIFFGSFKEVCLLRTTIGEYLADVYNKTEGPYHGFFALHQPCLLLKSPELIKHILQKDFSYFHDRAFVSNEKDDPIGTHNLFAMKNEDWKTMRVKLTPVFSSGKVKAMFNLMNEVGKQLHKCIDRMAIGKDSAECKEICVRYTTDVITSCAFGIQANCLLDENAPFREVGKKLLTFTYSRGIQMSAYFFAPDLVKMFGFKFFEPECAQFLRKVFNESLNHRSQNQVKRNDLIDILIEIKKNDSSLRDDKLVAQAAIFFSAGFESSSSLMSFTLYELCLNTNIQVKLRSEIKSVLAKYNNELTYEGIQEMTYLEMVCCETLRKYPPLPFLDRRCMKEYIIPGTNVALDKGILVYIPLLGLHYDPEYFPQPQKYDPERFSEVNKRKYPFGVYMPFGEGPHNCIGARFGLLNSKVGLVHILSQFEVEKASNTPTNVQLDPKGFLVTALNGLPIKFKQFNIIAA